MKKVVVTGAAGFIGSHICEELLASEQWEVVGIDSFTSYYDVGLKQANLEASLSFDRFTLVDIDINSPDLEGILEGASGVIHQAGQPGVRSSWGRDFGHYTHNNVSGTQNLLEVSRRVSDLEAFVYASSSSVYGAAERYPTTEDDLPMPRSPYGVTKLAAEHLCSLYAANWGIPTVSLRYFTVFGPRQRPDMAFHRFCRAALLGDELPLYGTGEQIRDFTFVTDVVDANVRALSGEAGPGSVFNVSGGGSISVNETFKIIEEIVGRRLQIARSGAVAGDVLQTGGDHTRIQNALGWRPKVDVREGLRREVAWMKAILGL